MKKFLILIAFLPLIGYSQTKIGLKTGAIFTKSGLSQYENSTGYNVGILFHHNFSDLVGLMVEPGILQKQTKRDSGFMDFTGSSVSMVTEKRLYNYIDVPVLLSLTPIRGDFSLGLHTGISALINTSAKNTFGQFGESDIENQLKSTAFDYIIGVNPSYAVGKLNIGAILRYGYNISGTYEAVDYKTNYVGVLVSLTYTIN
jgi:hypothetical protein